MNKLNYEKAISNIRRELGVYINENGIKSLVIGVSGGIDSALCCALAKPVCDGLKIPLIGRSIPIVSNKDDELTRASLIGKSFCTDFDVQPLDVLYLNTTSVMLHDDMNKSDEKVKIRRGNIKARLRMIYLYDLAQKHNGMVLSTDNYTELLLGFWTLHGDVGDYGMIQNLWKTEVYEMSTYIMNNEYEEGTPEAYSLKLCIDATPTDGLGVSNSDLDQIGASSYEEVDNILKTYIEKSDEYKDHPVVQRHEKTHFKRLNPINIPRDIIEE